VAHPPICPRCGGGLQPPSAFASTWRCVSHGVVDPLHILRNATPEAIKHVCDHTRVPCWAPTPMPTGWALAGLAYAGDERSRGHATVVACSGPAPLGGVADMLLVAEEPGTGAGAGYAGLAGPDPGPTIGARAATVETAGHPTALWAVDSPDDRCVLIGEAKGLWLWAILWPAEAGYLLAENVTLHDLRESVPSDLYASQYSPYLLRRRR
jgi:hypothetical protein